MILYSLVCAKGHHFEGWFRNSDAFDQEASARRLSCPVCGNDRIAKAIMAPRIAKGEAPAAEPTSQEQPSSARAKDSVPVAAQMSLTAEEWQVLKKLREKVEAECDYVGSDFAEEARRIHYGETESRQIYGETTPDEAAALEEEGIEFGVVPWVPCYQG